MEEKIDTGTILMKEGTLLPEGLQLESEPFSKRWKLVQNLDARGLDRKIHEAGWTLFFMAHEVNATAIGSELKNTTRRAVRRAIAHIKSDRLNCLEITQLAAKRFLGHWRVNLTAHPRHIQESMFLFRTKEATERDRAQLAAA